MATSVSVESASLASTHSWRRRAHRGRAPRGRSRSSASSAVAAAVRPRGEHGFVEVDAAEALDALRLAEDLEAVGGLAQHRGVEGAAAEVVDGDDVAGLDPLVGA